MERRFPHPAVIPFLLAQAVYGILLLPPAGRMRNPGGLSGEWGLCLCLAFTGQVAAGILLPLTPRLRSRLALWFALTLFNLQLLCLWDINQSYHEWMDQGRQHARARFAREESLSMHLLAATTAGETDRAESLLKRWEKEGPRALGRDATVSYALGIAAGNRDTKTARLLLHHGADPNDTDEEGATPLFSAIGSTAMMRLLIQCGARISAPAKKEWDPFVHAAALGATDSVRLLLDQGVSPRGPRGDTALAAAVSGGFDDTVALLLARGANINGIYTVRVPSSASPGDFSAAGTQRTASEARTSKSSASSF